MSPIRGREGASTTARAASERRLGARSALLIVSVTVLAQAWILRLPFQSDDFLLLPDPLALFTHVERLASHDVPAFMCRMPMWLAWALVRAVAPEPLSPVPFHVLGLALHACAALLLARAVARHAPGELARDAAWLAGCLFGVAGGAIQAVSWTAAWSSLFYTLFALAALNVALDGRRAGLGAAGFASAAGAGVLLCLATLSKVSGALACTVVLGLLLMTGAAARAWRRTGLELGLGGAGVALGLVVRSWFLRTAHLRYEARVEPGLGELPALVGRGFHALGQALYPWNRDPLFTGDEPLLARLSGPLHLEAWAIAVLTLAPIALLALVRAPRVRPALLALTVVLVPAVVPAGAIYAGWPTNVVAREAYLPLAVAAAALALAAAALRPRRAHLGRPAAVLLVLVFVDGNRHVARTERLHADEVRSVRALLARLAEEAEAARPGREPLVLAVIPDAGFGGIPSLGGLFPLCFDPPFEARRRLELRGFSSPSAIAEWITTEPDIGRRDVILIGPEHDGRFEPIPPDPALSGADNRARRLLRAWTPLRHGLEALASVTAAPTTPTDGPHAGHRFVLDASADPPLWRADPPLPAHAVGALALDVEDGAPVRGALGFELPGAAEDLLLPIDDPGSPGTRLTLELPLSLALRFGPPLRAVSWHGPSPPSTHLTPLAAPPTLTPLSPAEDLLVPADPSLPPPTFRVDEPPPPLRRGAFARLELRFTLLGRAASLFSDLPLTRATPLVLHPTGVHLEAPPTPRPPMSGTPWPVLVSDHVLSQMQAGALPTATFTWRITLHHAGGAPAARSPFRQGRFVRE